MRSKYLPKLIKRIFLIIGLILLIVGFVAADYWNLLPQKYYKAEDFNIITVHSKVDFNHNGLDDYTDILLGARSCVATKPHYKSDYYIGGYPPDDVGVCTDVIWQAFKNAGYDLKAMVDRDIQEHLSAYPRVNGQPDPNIDFRRVPNLKVFLEHYAVTLTTDATKIEEWQPGDIVTYGLKHIAIVSDRRNKDGVAYIIHNGGQPRREEDALTRKEISGHFRFDAARITETRLIPWNEQK